jgi:hypothetical protein
MGFAHLCVTPIAAIGGFSAFSMSLLEIAKEVKTN